MAVEQVGPARVSDDGAGAAAPSPPAGGRQANRVLAAMPAVAGAQAGPRLRIHIPSRIVTIDGRPLALTRLEYDLLVHLCRSPRRVHRRADLMSAVWGLPVSLRQSRTVDVHIRRLRRKLGDDLPLITTVRGVGYRVDAVGLYLVDESVHDPAGRGGGCRGDTAAQGRVGALGDAPRRCPHDSVTVGAS
ncbi:hypothetical protein BJF85_00825 [Saccharomonospora sp. CUA-673]|uniref:winged helix-turn-helix domain-containing protein n=1 Tax=Saccharomonospora sp. CUA-673 TaxID=1904969 RepID=UPI0009630B91|nr:winged helix-turn-helix domain-containing protein [Saccharomonospora sp. CUA-673]OLT47012.1 hypothetical protein BJF85_00825 [Saccharomonospora sp. CUA-673]